MGWSGLNRKDCLKYMEVQWGKITAGAFPKKSTRFMERSLNLFTETISRHVVIDDGPVSSQHGARYVNHFITVKTINDDYFEDGAGRLKDVPDIFDAGIWGFHRNEKEINVLWDLLFEFLIPLLVTLQSNDASGSICPPER